MLAASADAAGTIGDGALALGAPPPLPEPCTPAELRALVLGGWNESDACEAVLAQVARIEGSLDVEIGDGLLAMTVGDRLISRGFSRLRDYAREILDVEERTAEAMERLSRGLRTRVLLRAAVRAGEVQVRSAQTVLPVAVGDSEAEWSFEHYSRERLRLSPRTVEQRAALEKRLWEVPALRAARDAGLGYEKVRLLARLPARDVDVWAARARTMTCVELRAALEDREDAQMRAARVLRARVPARVALVLQAAFRAVRAVEGCLLDDGRCLVRVARHFIETWKAHVKKARTRSQKVRERDLGRCCVPGCSRRAVHAHHIIPKSRGGTDDPENLVALCACHHLRGIHGGYMRAWGLAPDHLVWEVAGRIWRDGVFGIEVATEEAAA